MENALKMSCFEGRIWDLIVSVPDHCLSFYFNVIRSLYANIKSKVMTDNDSSAYFPCMNGVR